MTRDEFISRVRTVQDDLRRFLLVLCCGNGPRADDLAQDALLKAYLAINSLKKAESFKSWLMSIAYRLFADSERSARPAAVALECGASVASPAAAPMEYADLYAALARLSAAERTAIVLYYLEGYSIKDITTLTGAGESAVKQHLSRGRRHLKTALCDE